MSNAIGSGPPSRPAPKRPSSILNQSPLSTTKQADALQWINSVLSLKLKDFENDLKSGEYLCELLNKIKPQIIKKINKIKQPYMQMENIKNFLDGCRALGMQDRDMFVTVDLFEAKNLSQVAHCITELAKLAKNINNSLPSTHVRNPSGQISSFANIGSTITINVPIPANITTTVTTVNTSTTNAPKPNTTTNASTTTTTSTTTSTNNNNTLKTSTTSGKPTTNTIQEEAFWELEASYDRSRRLSQLKHYIPIDRYQ